MTRPGAASEKSQAVIDRPFVRQRGGKRLLLWQCATVALLSFGYAGYYLCRSNLSVTLPMISGELTSSGMDAATASVRLGLIASLGVLAYALAKFPSGGIADFFGGRRNFLAGMAGSAVFTFVFAWSGGSFSLMAAAWMSNRAVQATGWVGIVKLASRWFSASSYGTVMAIISLSYLFGDAAARQFMALLIAWGFGWREVFYVAGGTLLAVWVITFVLLRETPASMGEAEPAINPANVFGADGTRPAPSGLFSLLLPLFSSREFWLACILSLGFTLVRETFNLWTPTYFTQAVGLSSADAAGKSALFPFFGGVSVLLCGVASDRLGKLSRAAIMFGGLVASGIVLLFLGFSRFTSPGWPVVLVAMTAFLLIGPYSFLAGAVAMDFGGRQGSATAAGVIDGVGYLGGVLAGDGIARLAVAFGWGGAFTALSGVCFLSSVAALIYARRLWRISHE